MRNEWLKSVKFFGLILSFVFLFISSARTETVSTSDPYLKEIISRMENRLGTWVGYQAKIRLHAYSGTDDHAVCEGDLAYHRLNETLMLRCYSQKNPADLLFAFKSLDRDFEFYQPKPNLLYQGTIFDLEDHPTLDSHIKPLDLYRALKSYSFLPAQARLEKANRRQSLIAVTSSRRGVAYVQRRLWLNKHGDAFEEKYFLPEGTEELFIERSKYRTIQNKLLPTKPYWTYPQIIEMREPESRLSNGKSTKIEFLKLDYVTEFNPKTWDLPLQTSTKKIPVADMLPVLEAEDIQITAQDGQQLIAKNPSSNS